MHTLVILQQMAVIAILVLIGFYLQKKEILEEQTEKKLSAIVMDIVNPALIMSCVLTGDLTATHQDLIHAIGIGVLLYAVFCLLGILIPKILPIKKEDRKFYHLMTVYTNVGFIGIPVAKAVLPENAMLCVIVCNVLYCLLFYTHGIMVLAEGREKIRLKKILSPGTVMAILTLLLFWFDISLPEIVANSVIYIGNATVFLSMSLLGASIAKTSIREGIKDKSIWLYLLIRMVAVPVVLVLILRTLNVASEMVQAFFLMAAMPVGNLPLIQAEKIGEKTEILSRGIVVTTVLCFFTITGLMAVLKL